MSTRNITERQLFSERLKSLRGNRNKAQFSRELCIPAPVYQRYEEGRIPNHDNLSVIACKCGVTVDWLLGRTELHNVAKNEMVSFLAQSEKRGDELHNVAKNEMVSFLAQSEKEGEKTDTVSVLPPGPMRTIESVSGRELLFYRTVDEQWLEKEAAAAVADIPGSGSLRDRVGRIGTAIEILVELQERCVDKWTGRKRKLDDPE
jgi:transcriptional regulator with XRE-family HTH domain